MGTKENEDQELKSEVMAVKAMLEHAYFCAEDAGAKKLAEAILVALIEAQNALPPTIPGFRYSS